MSRNIFGVRPGLTAVIVLSLTAITRVAVSAGAGPLTEIRFVMHRLGHYRSEACGTGDFNNDGKLDIVAGPYLYLAPDFKPVEIRKVATDVNEKGIGYCDDFMNLVMDVDGDGRLGVVSCSWFKMRSTWYRNTGTGSGLWPESVIENNGNFEAGDLWDLHGTGKRDVILPAVQRTVWYELGAGPDGKRQFIPHVVSERQLTWGVGVGDINGDGRPDILRPDAWFEAPADIRQGRWIEHPLSLGNQNAKIKDTAQIWVYDVNSDGLNDIICSLAHDRGVFWYEQVRQGAEVDWKQHVIDDSWTQAHALTLADIDNDGVPEIITGKRFMAHNGNDPDAFGPLGVYCYKLKGGARPIWVKHVISYHEGIGAGMNIEVADLNSDGKLDIVVTGKWGGPVWFENVSRRTGDGDRQTPSGEWNGAAARHDPRRGGLGQPGLGLPDRSDRAVSASGQPDEVLGFDAAILTIPRFEKCITPLGPS